jgi:hypothetical protein
MSEVADVSFTPPQEIGQASMGSENLLPEKNFPVKVALIVVVLAALGLSGALFSWKNSQTPTSTSPTATPPASLEELSVIGFEDFFFFAAPQTPELSIFDLPNSRSLNSVLPYRDKLWITSRGSIIEYDPTSQQMVSYSHAKKANCDANLVVVNDFIYAACRTEPDGNEFMDWAEPELFYGRYSILKINPNTHQVERVFSAADGLEDGYNYKLVADGAFVWVATFEGVGRIDTRTNQVDFYTAELGFGPASSATKLSIDKVLADQDHVWVVLSANAYSQGGLALFTKSTQQWQAFGPRELMDYEFDRIDIITTIKLVPGGVQIGFRDGQMDNFDRFVEKQYLYQEGKWKKVNGDRIATGEQSESTFEYIEDTYGEFEFGTIDKRGLTQIRLPDSNQILTLNGRDNYYISEEILGKRYILTSATVDILDDSKPFPHTLTYLHEDLTEGFYPTYLSEAAGRAQLLIDPETMLALAVYEGEDGMFERVGQKVTVVNLETGKMLRSYSAENGLTGVDFLHNLKMSKSGSDLVLSSQGGEKVVKVNTQNYALTLLKEVVEQ